MQFYSKLNRNRELMLMINNPASLPASDTYRHTYSPPEEIFKKDIARTGSNYEQLITTASWNSCPEAMILIPIFTSPSLCFSNALVPGLHIPC